MAGSVNAAAVFILARRSRPARQRKTPPAYRNQRGCAARCKPGVEPAALSFWRAGRVRASAAPSPVWEGPRAVHIRRRRLLPPLSATGGGPFAFRLQYVA
jgi:hypothetical protein